MEMNIQAITMLIEKVRDDEEMMELINDAFSSFEAYHKAIYDLEKWKWFTVPGSMDLSLYQDTLKSMDSLRTRCHNDVLTHMNILNRLAKSEGVDPIYAGIISEQRPYRRECADAVLHLIETMIRERS